MNIVIVGTGYVGLVTGVGLAELGNTVTFIDLDTEKIKKLKNKELPFFEPDLDKYFSKIENFERMSFHSNYEELNWDNVEVVFICVQTPNNTKTNSVDTKFLESAISKIAELNNKDIIITVKSTIPPYEIENVCNNIGFDQNLITFNPEFLREGSAVYDFFNPDRIVLGGLNTDKTDKLKSLYKAFDVIIFQNEDDKSQLENYLKFNNKSQLIESSGINTEEYVLKKTFNKKLKIILASRLLKDKGIIEYSNLIKKFDKNKFEFYLAGEIDKGNPSSLNENELEEILKDKSLKFLGYLDIKNELHNYDILISMSKYEGFSRIMLEGTYVGLFCASLENSGTKFIKELENTILINAEELENAHNEINMILTNSMDISLNNRTQIINKYSTKVVAEKFLTIYKEI